MRWMPALLLCGVLAAAPGAQAYVLSTMEFDAMPLVPDTGSADARVEAEFTCEELRPYLLDGAVEVDLEWSAANAQIIITGPRLITVSTEPCIQQGLSGSVSQEIEATFAATSMAPGELPIMVQLTTDPKPSSNGQLEQQTVSGYVAVEFLGRLDAQASPDGGRYHNITIENLGNSRTEVVARVASVPDGVTVILPDPILLESPNYGASPTSMSVTAQVIGASENDDAVVLEFVPASTKNTSQEGPAARVTLPVAAALQASSSLDEQVIPAPLFAPVVLAGLAALRRRT